MLLLSAICLWQKSWRVSTVQLQHPSLAARSKARNKKSLFLVLRGVAISDEKSDFSQKFARNFFKPVPESSPQNRSFSISQHGTFFHLKLLPAQCDLDSRYCKLQYSKNLDIIIACQVRCAEYKMGRRLVRYSLLWARKLWHVPWPGFFLYLVFYIVNSFFVYLPPLWTGESINCWDICWRGIKLSKSMKVKIFPSRASLWSWTGYLGGSLSPSTMWQRCFFFVTFHNFKSLLNHKAKYVQK